MSCCDVKGTQLIKLQTCTQWIRIYYYIQKKYHRFNGGHIMFFCSIYPPTMAENIHIKPAYGEKKKKKVADCCCKR